MRYVVSLNSTALAGQAPEWIELLPPGPVVSGVDGRSWRLDDPESVVASSQNRMPLLIDWEHASEIRSPQGQEAPAAGWVTELEVRDGSVWGRVEWTPRAVEQIRNREYRYISPVHIYGRESGRIVRLCSAALTNQPNLRQLTALNHDSTMEEDSMDELFKALCAALGLSQDASQDDVLRAVNSLKTSAASPDRGGAEGAGKSKDAAAGGKALAALGLNAEATEEDVARAVNTLKAEPSLERYVPRQDYDAAVNRAANAEQKLRDHQAEQRKAEVDAAITGALQAGKISPATEDFYRATCRTDDGLAGFKEFVSTAPEIVPESDRPKGTPPEEASKALNAEEAKIAEMFGNTAEDLAKYAKD